MRTRERLTRRPPAYAPVKSPKRMKLKPCPFDGGKAALEKKDGHLCHFVQCSRCHARTTYFRLQVLAVNAWQGRVK